MALNRTIEQIGRRLRVGVLGGGESSAIGPAHRTAMRFDDNFEIIAGVLSRDAERSNEEGRRLGFRRTYGTLAHMLSDERSLPDGIDLLAIMAPNEVHAPAAISAMQAGYHVICDKPIANDLREAMKVLAELGEKGPKFCVTYNYTGYAMVRQAKAMVTGGMVGVPHLVEVRYAQGSLGSLVEQSGELSPQLEWRLDPNRGGANNLLLDLGTHAQNLTTYVTGRQFTEVFADLGSAVKGRSFDDSAVVVGRLEGGVRATISATKAATGAPQIFTLSVYGDRGGVVWELASPNTLQYLTQGSPVQIYNRGCENLSPAVRRSIRPLYPHPEGFREAFANIYADFAEIVASTIAGTEPSAEALEYPSARSGAISLAWVEACVESKRTGAWVSVDMAGLL